MDYRQSHQDPAKARLYHESFTKYPYRQIVWEWERDVLNHLVQGFAEKKSALNYLDFACGTGRILALLEEYMEESYGVDISESMLRIARANVRHSNLLLCDLSKEEVFPDGYFDLITTFRFFLNAQQDLKENVLSAFGRILKKDAYLIFNIHMNKGCLLEKELRVYQALKHIRNPNFHSISLQETTNLLRNFRFDVIQTFHYGVFPIYREERKPFINQINYVERLCSRLPTLLQISRYIIYVCRFNSGI